MKFKHENFSVPIPETILNMYKIDEHDNVAYENYIKSKTLFNPEVDQESQSMVLKTKNEILNSPMDQQVFLIMGALESGDIEIQRIGASMIQNTPKDKRESLEKILNEKIVEALNNPNIEIQRIAMNIVQFATEDTQDQLREIVLQKIIDGFNSDDENKWKILAKKINLAPNSAQESLREIVYRKITEMLSSDNIRIQRLASIMVQYAPKNKQVELNNIVKIKYESAKRQGKFKEIVESPLYAKNEKDYPSNFSHEKLPKTGSETTLLLGPQFKNNLIIRHIEKPCFMAWQKAYESHVDWNKAGFSYVPIEPIYSFRQDGHGKLIDTVSGVLDLNLEEWYAFSGHIFREHLDEQKNKIINALKYLDINHGHPNDANFCLRFYRDENGNIDINKAPRIYLIDFDKAVTS